MLFKHIPLQMIKSHPFSALWASWFGAGFLPVMPGTWGSIAAFLSVLIPLHLCQGRIHGQTITLTLMAATGVITGIGCVACRSLYRSWNHTHRAPHDHHDHGFDPSWIVIDEVAGYGLGVTMVSCFLPLTPLLLLAVLCVFRILDIKKPWPIGFVERKMGSHLILAPYGVMVDDLVAGALTGIIIIMVFS